MLTSFKDNKIILEFDVGNYNKDLVDLLSMIEIANKSKTTENDINEMARDIKTDWWQKNKTRFINENNH